jgi:hypothetical protein
LENSCSFSSSSFHLFLKNKDDGEDGIPAIKPRFKHHGAERAVGSG